MLPKSLEGRNVLDSLYARWPGTKLRTVTKVARELLLIDGPLLCGGESVRVRAQSVGAGVYDVWFEKIDYTNEGGR